MIEIDENDVVPDQQQPTSSSSSIDSEQQKRKNTEDKYAHLKKKRLSYPAKFKGEVIQDRENGLKSNELVQKYSNFRLDVPNISRWMKEKHVILTADADEHKRLLKIRPSIKHNELFDKLRPLFHEARSKGKIVDFNWLWSKTRKIYKDQGKEEVVKKHVIVTFIRRNHLKYRRIQRNENQHKEYFPEKLVKWHGTLRERLVR